MTQVIMNAGANYAKSHQNEKVRTASSTSAASSVASGQRHQFFPLLASHRIVKNLCF